VAGAGDTGCAVVGVGARADDRRVADAAEALAGHPAGGGAGGDVALGVQRHAADGAEVVGVPVRLGGGPWLGLGFLLLEPCLNLFPAALGEEVFGIDHLEPVVAGEFLGATVGEQDVRRLFHHGAGGADGVLHRGHAADRAGLQRAAVHDRGVEFVFALGGEDRALAGVEHRRVLHDDDRCLDGVERAATALEDRVPGAERLLERGVVQPLALGGE